MFLVLRLTVTLQTEREVLRTIRQDGLRPSLGAIRSLSQAPLADDWYDTLEGRWRVEWTDLGKSRVDKALSSLFTPSLRLLSFGVLPPLQVDIQDSLNVVDNGTYDLIQVFDGFAMRLSGPCEKNDNGRVFVTFESVEPLPGSQQLEDLGLEPGVVSIPKPKKTYIDVTYISPSLRVHRGASGKTYVLSRCDDTSPFF